MQKKVKKWSKNLVVTKISRTFALAFEKHGRLAQLV